MSNMDLWHKVEKTDPAHTKPITGKAYKGNSPKPHYIIMKATETFGPCGIGWGFEIIEEKLLDGAMLEPGFYERIHMARVRVWYEWDGKRGAVEHVGQTVFSGRRNSGAPFTDEDAPKKSVTDGLIKALSMVGFAGDIFLGRYDDSKYVSDLKREIAQEEQSAPRAGAEQAGGEASNRAASPSADPKPDAFGLPPLPEGEPTESQKLIYAALRGGIGKAGNLVELELFKVEQIKQQLPSLTSNQQTSIEDYYKERYRALRPRAVS